MIDRAQFIRRLEDAAAGSERGNAPAVLLIGLDDFTTINDVLGYVVGDRVLAAVARMLEDVADDAYDLARFGGDQFALLVPDEAIDALVDRIMYGLASPLDAGGQPVSTRASIGIAQAAPGDSGLDLLSKADVALRMAKDRGRGRPAHYESGMKIRFLDQAALLEGLHEAVTGGQLELVYQPVVRLHDGTLTGLEALARWRHPTRGPIMPGDFIPVAERSGLIVPLGRWMLAEVCREQEEDWPETYVNTSAHQLREPGFADTLTRLITSPERLIIEVTGDALVDRTATRALRAVRQSGVRVCLDDFGGGPASLPALADAPIDVVKLHGSMTERIITAPRLAAVARSVASLADDLGIVPIAKAVESAAQAEMLYEIGFRQGMGFHYAVPQPARAIPLFLQGDLLSALGTKG